MEGSATGLGYLSGLFLKTLSHCELSSFSPRIAYLSIRDSKRVASDSEFCLFDGDSFCCDFQRVRDFSLRSIFFSSAAILLSNSEACRVGEVSVIKSLEKGYQWKLDTPIVALSLRHYKWPLRSCNESLSLWLWFANNHL